MFLMNFKNHIVKWYQTVLLPVFHIDNSGKRQRFRTEGNDGYTEDAVEALETVNYKKPIITDGTDNKILSASDGGVKKTSADNDAEAILNRINQDRENKYMNDIELARKKA